MKIGIYTTSVRIFLSLEEARILMTNPKGDSYVVVTGTWDKGYTISGRRKISHRGEGWSGWFSHYIDLGTKSISSPHGHSSGSYDVEFNRHGNGNSIIIHTNRIERPSVSQNLDKLAGILKGDEAKPVAAKPAPVVADPAPIHVVAETPKSENVAKVTTAPGGPLPNIPKSWIDLQSMENVPSTGVGLKEALSLVYEELAKYNANSLVALEPDVIDGRIVLKPVGFKAA